MMKRYIKERVVPFLAAALLPFIPMLYIYGKSKNAQYSSLLHVLLFGLAMMVMSIILYLITLKITKKPARALMVSVVAWLAFFLLGVPASHLVDMVGGTGTYRVLMKFAYSMIWLIIVAVIWFFACRLAKKMDLTLAGRFTSIMLAFLLIYNGGVSIYKNLELQKRGSFEVKPSFAAQASLPSPNIYWVHCDGMLGFDAMEKYFGDAQTEFSQQLEARGFLIDRDGKFDGGNCTQYAVPCLMSPGYYDQNGREEIKKSSTRYADSLLARIHNELIGSFIQKGYYTSTIVNAWDMYYFPVGNDYYVYSKTEAPLLHISGENSDATVASALAAGRLSSLVELLRQYNPFARLLYEIICNQGLDQWLLFQDDMRPLDTATAEASILASNPSLALNTKLRSLISSLGSQTPRFVLMHDLTAHGPFMVNEGGENLGIDDIQNYPINHRRASKELLDMADLILEQDPDAVIILQADHGLHMQSASQIMTGLSAGEEAVSDIWQSVMSAVRIPAQYNPPEAPLHPLDIARYLVNEYVGPNYEYLYYDTESIGLGEP